MRTVLIFANPIAGQGRGQRIAQALRTILFSSGFDARVFLDRPQEVTRDALGDAEDAQFAAAISIGGDGTLRGVVQRLIELMTASRSFMRRSLRAARVVRMASEVIISFSSTTSAWA